MADWAEYYALEPITDKILARAATIADLIAWIGANGKVARVARSDGKPLGAEEMDEADRCATRRHLIVEIL